MDDCHRGYPEVATFQCSDRNFLQYRSFGYLHARLLSSLQYDVERLESKLNELDDWEVTSGDKEKLRCKERDDLEDSLDRTSDRFRAMFDVTRPQVQKNLKSALMEYGACIALQRRDGLTVRADEVLLKTQHMLTLQRPSRKDYESVRDWFLDFNPLVEDEQSFIRRKEDIITLRTGRECAIFDAFVERSLSKLDRFLVAHLGWHIIQVRRASAP